MKTKIVTIALISSITLFSSCTRETGKGEIRTEERQVNSFTKIDLSNSADVEIVKGETLKVEVSDYENLLDNISVETVNNKLVIKNKPLRIHIKNSKAKVKITIPNTITSIDLSGSGNITITDGLASTVSLQISGSGNITANTSVDLTSVDLDISGSGNIEMNGITTSLHTNISGSGNINCKDLEAQTANCDISGSGDITARVMDNLQANISGSGNISYYGTATVSTDISGSGNVTHK